MDQFKHIKVSIEAGLARIVIDRPENANALDLTSTSELHRAALLCDASPEVRAVLLTGTGPTFCVGGDLKAFNGYDGNLKAYIKAAADAIHNALAVLRRMDAPLVVAVNGTAAGAGFSLAMAGDLVLAARSARFTVSFTAAGLVPDSGATFHLPRLVGLRRAQELIFTNRLLSADEALEWGVINQVVDDAVLINQAEFMARQLADGPTHAYGAAKRLLLDSYGHSLEHQLGLEARGVAAAADHPEGREGIAAFSVKRKPNFR
ncbi:MAG: enoyl-CoA hydratase/isomerase family protein [Pseudomonadota bacterium]